MKYQKRASSIGCAFNEKAIERMLELKFKKKPVVIDALQWTGDNLDAVLEFTKEGNVGAVPGTKELMIDTLEGTMSCPVGHWIIRGVKGEFYACDPAIFKMSYERTYEE